MEGNRRFHLVTFELDGTMLNDEWAHAEANRRIGAKLGIDCTALGDMTGYSVRTRWQALCRQADVTADVEEIARDHFRITLEIIRQARIPESAGLTKTLRALRAAGYTLAVVSSSDEDFVRAVTDYLGVADLLDCFVTQSQVAVLKPAPDIYRKVQALTGIHAAAALGVEDSAPGCQALRGAGMYTVGFTDEGRNRQDLSAADTHIAVMGELLPLIHRLQNP